MIKKIISYSIFILTGLSGAAQKDNAEQINKRVFIYPQFVQGKVHFINGTNQAAMLNYNALFQQMIFVQNGLMLTLDNINTIDTVYIDSNKFVPVDTVFYEVKLEGTSFPLFIKHTCIVSKSSVNTGFGAFSQTGAVQDISGFRLGVATPYQLIVDANYTAELRTSFFIKNKNTYVQLKGVKQIKVLFPDKENLVKDFIKENKTDFSKEPDIEKLLLFCSRNKS